MVWSVDIQEYLVVRVMADLRVDASNHTGLAVTAGCLGAVEPDRLVILDNDVKCGTRR